MKLLLTNDDGVEARGLAALCQAVGTLGEPVVVAPFEAASGCSHAVTTHRPFRVERLNAARYAVDGTPADCVRVGLARVARDAAWVLAGINHGGNLGRRIGTVQANLRTHSDERGHHECQVP